MTYALFGDNSSQAEGIILKQLEKYHIYAITYL